MELFSTRKISKSLRFAVFREIRIEFMQRSRYFSALWTGIIIERIILLFYHK